MITQIFTIMIIILITNIVTFILMLFNKEKELLNKDQEYMENIISCNNKLLIEKKELLDAKRTLKQCYEKIIELEK